MIKITEVESVFDIISKYGAYYILGSTPIYSYFGVDVEINDYDIGLTGFSKEKMNELLVDLTRIGTIKRNRFSGFVCTSAGVDYDIWRIEDSLLDFRGPILDINDYLNRMIANVYSCAMTAQGSYIFGDNFIDYINNREFKLNSSIINISNGNKMLEKAIKLHNRVNRVMFYDSTEKIGVFCENCKVISEIQHSAVCKLCGDYREGGLVHLTDFNTCNNK